MADYVAGYSAGYVQLTLNEVVGIPAGTVIAAPTGTVTYVPAVINSTISGYNAGYGSGYAVLVDIAGVTVDIDFAAPLGSVAASTPSVVAGVTADIAVAAPAGTVTENPSVVDGITVAITIAAPLGEFTNATIVYGLPASVAIAAPTGAIIGSTIVAGVTVNIAVAAPDGAVVASASIVITGFTVDVTVTAVLGAVPVPGTPPPPSVPANVAEITVAQVARVYLAPTGTVEPIDASAALATGWREVGLFVADSLSVKDGRSSTTLGAFDVDGGGVPIPTESYATLEVVMQQWNGANFSAVVGGGTSQQIAPSQYRWEPQVNTGRDKLAAIAEIADGTRKYRYVLPRCVVNSDEIEWQMRKANEVSLPLRLRTIRTHGSAPPYYVLSTDSAFAPA